MTLGGGGSGRNLLEFQNCHNKLNMKLYLNVESTKYSQYAVNVCLSLCSIHILAGNFKILSAGV